MCCPIPAAPPKSDFSTLKQFVNARLTAGTNLTVLKTDRGLGRKAWAVAIDTARWPEGHRPPLSGDDTIFIATAGRRARTSANWPTAFPRHLRTLKPHDIDFKGRGAEAHTFGIFPAASTHPSASPWLKDTYQRPVITVNRRHRRPSTRAAAKSLAERSVAAGRHRTSSHRCTHRLFRPGAPISAHGQCAPAAGYTRCASAPSAWLQAQTIAQMALSLKTTMVAHGCTAAGQRSSALRKWRLRTLGAGPRDHRAGFATGRSSGRNSSSISKIIICRFHPSARAYSVNRGLWGVHHRRQGDIDRRRAAFRRRRGYSPRTQFSAPRLPERHSIGFQPGSSGQSSTAPHCLPSPIIEKLEAFGRSLRHWTRHPFGRHRESAPRGGSRSRPPAADVLLTAHRELEKLVLTGQAGAHQGLCGPTLWHRPWCTKDNTWIRCCRDIEALVAVLSGRASAARSRFCFRPGSAFVEGVASPYSLMAASKGRLRRIRR